MNLLATVDQNWAIGNQGQLLVSIPEDQRLLREETLGKVLVMSKKTLENYPGKQPLYGRVNVILTSDKNYKVKGAVVCHSFKEVMSQLDRYNSDDVFIVGGQRIYEQFLPYCNTAHITAIDYEYQADRYCPNLESDSQWMLTAEGEEQTYFDLCYTFRRYEKIGIG